MNPTIFYSQNREDLILAAFFADTDKGFYVDVGAHHPTHDSVTKYFYDKGWAGINIEPQEHLFNLLTRSRRRDANLNVGVSKKPGALILRKYKGDGLSTFSRQIKDLYKKNKSMGTSNYKDIAVKVDTLNNIFTKQKVTSIQFLKIDVEGFEYEVLEGNNWSKYRPEIICIEANHIVKDWHSLINANNYEFAFFDGLNEYFVADEARFRIGLFRKAFPELLVSAPILSYGWLRQIKKLTAQLAKTRKGLNSQTEENKLLTQKLQNLQKGPNDKH